MYYIKRTWSGAAEEVYFVYPDKFPTREDAAMVLDRFMTRCELNGYVWWTDPILPVTNPPDKIHHWRLIFTVVERPMHIGVHIGEERILWHDRS